MKLTDTQMHDFAHSIAADHPHILLNALRKNGFWLYAIHKTDIDSVIQDAPNKHHFIDTPITDDDMAYVNNHYRVEENIDYGVITSAIISDIHEYHFDKENSKNG